MDCGLEPPPFPTNGSGAAKGGGLFPTSSDIDLFLYKRGPSHIALVLAALVRPRWIPEKEQGEESCDATVFKFRAVTIPF